MKKPNKKLSRTAGKKEDVTKVPESVKRKNLAAFILLGLTAVLLTVLLIGTKLYIGSLSKNPAKNPKAGSPDDLKQTVEKVGRHILLPDEEPKLVTVTDARILKASQPFFANAKDGDKVLVYSHKVILYDPDIDKIVEVAQIKILPPTPAVPNVNPG